jgi:hypothetical protein
MAELRPAETPKTLRYSDADFLRIVDDECRRSVGFGEGDTGELARVRIRAQEYRQGKINDLAVIRGRSTAVDSTLSDAVDTLMPDVPPASVASVVTSVLAGLAQAQPAIFAVTRSSARTQAGVSLGLGLAEIIVAAFLQRKA